MSQQAVVIPSATILLLRDSPHGLEVFMVVRHHKIDSFSGALVFPGGKVDAADRSNDIALFCRNISHGNTNSQTLALQIAAIREAFEECGVLLAYPAGTEALISAERLSRFSHYRQALLDNALDMLELCRTEKLELATDLLQPYAHWITPKLRPKIFDTHFFMASAPPDQIARHDGSESLDSMWITPQQAVAKAEQGELTLVFPTRMNLLKLARCSNVEQAMLNARSETIVTIQPEVDVGEHGNIMSIPPNAGYPASRVFVPKDGVRFEFLD